jgi:hypothetical protein
VPDDYLGGEPLAVEQASGQGWKGALEILAEGGYIVWRGVGLTMRAHIGKGRSRIAPRLFVRVFTAFEPADVSPARAEAELRRAQGELEELKAESREFANLVTGRPVSYELLHDFGMGAVLIATWTEDGFEYRWKAQ